MNTEPQPIEWVEDHECEQRIDPAKAAVNLTTEEEVKAIEVKQS